MGCNGKRGVPKDLAQWLEAFPAKRKNSKIQEDSLLSKPAFGKMFMMSFNKLNEQSVYYRCWLNMGPSGQTECPRRYGGYCTPSGSQLGIPFCSSRTDPKGPEEENPRRNSWQLNRWLITFIRLEIIHRLTPNSLFHLRLDELYCWDPPWNWSPTPLS